MILAVEKRNMFHLKMYASETSLVVSVFIVNLCCKVTIIVLSLMVVYCCVSHYDALSWNANRRPFFANFPQAHST